MPRLLLLLLLFLLLPLPDFLPPPAADAQNLIVWQLNRSFSIDASTSPAFPLPQPNSLIFPFLPEVQLISASSAALNVSAFVFPCFFQPSPPADATIFALCLTGVAPYQASSSSLDGYPAVIWRANGLTPAHGDNFSLTLQQDGDLLLLGRSANDSVDTVAWRSNTSGMGVVRMELSQQPAELTLYDSNNVSVWQSSDIPADTLTYGQELEAVNKLVSYAVAADNKWVAEYILDINDTAQDLTLYFSKPNSSQATPYWNWQINGTSSLISSRGDCGPDINPCNDFFKPLVSVFAAFISSDGLAVGDPSATGTHTVVEGLTYAISQQNLQTTILRLGNDGNLRLLSVKRTWVVLAELFQGENACSLPQTCGAYGICVGATNQCKCPDVKAPFSIATVAPTVLAFEALDSNNPSQGCKLASPLQACSNATAGANAKSNSSALLEQVQMELLQGLDYFSLVPGALTTASNISSGDNCSSLCLHNCACLAAFWHTENRTCFVVSESQLGSFRGGLKSTMFNAYLKVGVLPSPAVPPTLPGSAPSIHQSNSRKLAVGVGIGVAAIVVASVSVVSFWCKRRNKKGFITMDDVLLDSAVMLNLPPRYSYSELHAITKGFSNLLGRGGFGSVYAGFLANGSVKVAVKKLEGIRQGEKEFKTELAIMGSIHHYNLLPLIGYCAEGADRRLLVYKYMENRSLDLWLFTSHERPMPSLNWAQRYSIAVGIAKGLAYLHDGCDRRIIHLDIKPQNILLDEGFVPKVADFGLSRGMEREESHVVTTMRGTPGYLAPEWLRDGIIDVKCDVFSFGMLLMEIVSGRKNLDLSRTEAPFYPEWAYSHLVSDRCLDSKETESETLSETNYSRESLQHVKNSFKFLPYANSIRDLTDAELEGEHEQAQLLRLIMTSFLCVLERPEWRPSMSNVVQMLEGQIKLSHVDLSSLHEGLVFVLRTYNSLSSGSQRYHHVTGMLSDKFKEQLDSVFTLSSQSFPSSSSAEECSLVSGR